MGKTDRDKFVKLSTLFPQLESDECRVCGNQVEPPLRKYCSYFCREVAEAVSRIFEWSRIRKYVLRRDDRTCQKCGDSAKTVDHITPVTKGGHEFDPKNLQTLCQSCNSEKGTKDISYRSDEDIRDNESCVSSRDLSQQLLTDYENTDND